MTQLDSNQGVVLLQFSLNEKEKIKNEEGKHLNLEQEEVIEELDVHLKSAINQQLGRASNDELTTQDLKQLTILDATQKNITILKGLEFATNLTSLSLRQNEIQDLTPLSNLKNLSYLDLRHNQIVDLEALSNLTNLTFLALEGNRIQDLTPLSNLTQLKTLVLVNNQISDLTPLSNLTSLNYLYLNQNQVRDLSPLEGLSLIDFYLTDQTILLESVTLQVGKKLKIKNPFIGVLWNQRQVLQYSLAGVCANYQEGSDEIVWDNVSEGEVHLLFESPDKTLSGTVIIPVIEVVEILDVHLKSAINRQLGKPVDHLLTKTDLEKLCVLEAPHQQIKDLSGLEFATQLTSLNLWDNEIQDLTPLKNLMSLKSLTLSTNEISDLSPLTNLKNLTFLTLSTNKISDLSPLASLTNLTALYLDNNQIQEVNTLADLTNLLSLSLERNQISDVTPLESLQQVEFFNVNSQEVLLAPLSIQRENPFHCFKGEFTLNGQPFIWEEVTHHPVECSFSSPFKIGKVEGLLSGVVQIPLQFSKESVELKQLEEVKEAMTLESTEVLSKSHAEEKSGAFSLASMVNHFKKPQQF